MAKVAVEKHLEPAAVAENAHKVHDYLNGPFFILRAALYFTIAGLIANRLNAWGKRFEDGRRRGGPTGKLRYWAGPAHHHLRAEHDLRGHRLGHVGRADLGVQHVPRRFTA